MNILENFGFKVFRLMEVKETDEYLLYDITKKKYNQYNLKRLLTIMDYILYEKAIDYKKIAVDELSYSDKQHKLSILKDWVDSYTKLIDNLGYKPIDDLIYEEENKIYFNLYKKEQLLKLECQEGDYIHIKSLIMNLTGHGDKGYDYFVKWLAWLIQNPLKRLPTSIILQGEQGTGKTKFCELVLKRIFGKNFCEIGQADINKEYNDFILGKQIIVANEVIHNDNKLLVPDKLKNFVTDEFLSINRKFKDTIYTRNYAQWIFVTNNDLPLKIEKGDRRYSVFKSKKLVNGTELIDGLLHNLDEELNHFVYDLKTMKVNFKEVSHPLMNEAKEDIIKLSQNSVEEFVDYLKDIGGIDIFAKKYKFDPAQVLFSSSLGSTIPTNIFYELYVRYCYEGGITYKFTRRSFSIHLKKLGFKDSVTTIDNDRRRVILIEGQIDERRHN